MSIRNLSNPQQKNSFILYAKDANIKYTTTDTVTATTGEINEVISENIICDRIYVGSIEGKNEDTDLSLDLMPATVGLPSQALCRSPNFNPEDPTTHKTVWRTVGGGGGNVYNPLTENLNGSNFNINNINTLETKKLTSPDILINCDSKALTNLNAVQLVNGLTLSASFPYTENYALYTTSTGVIDFKPAIFNPVEENINLNNKYINNCEVLDVNYLVSNTNNTVRVSSVLTLENDMNADARAIYNAGALTCYSGTVQSGTYLNLDLVPLTEGKANQYLARNSAFNPADPSTHKLVWQTPSGGGGNVTNPLSSDLDGGTFNINNVESLTSNYVDTDNINPKTGPTINITGNIDLNSNALLRVDRITAVTTATPSVDLKLDLIPSTIGTQNQVLSRASNFDPNNSSTHKLVWQTISGGGVQNPMISNLDGGNYNVSNLSSLTSTEIKTNTLSLSSGTIIQTSPLAVNTQLKVNTINTLTNPTILMPSVDFSGTIKTNTIDTYTGNNISCLHNLNIADNKQLKSPLLVSDGLYANTTDLTIAGLLPDGKTQSNINISAPLLTINNSFSPLTQETIVGLAGSIIFNNPVNNPVIHGSNLEIRGRTPTGVATDITIEGVSTAINSSTLNIFSTIANNIRGTTRFDKNINVLTERSASIGVRTTLFKTFGPMPNVNINSLTPVKLNAIIANQKGDNIIPSGGFANGDKFIIIMNGLLTTLASGSLNVYLYVGAVSILQFNVPNAVSTGQPCKLTFEIDCTVVGTTVDFGSGSALFTMERNNTSIRYSTASFTAPISNTGLSNSFDIYVGQSAAQVSNFTPTSYTIEQI